ncbi:MULTISPECIES: hypothetical protein [unclassified Clostridium]|uniref:hypothetical protein n=1 Tax=unclassified Clostridium TaxID=2614128 RepID=UPI0020792D12|nr:MULTISPECIES: hypothetical protein [unclassified Clostridium]
MWIRSQDKKHLHDVKHFDIVMSSFCKDNQRSIINQINYFGEDADLYEILGIYDSEKRCIEILDDITLKMFDCSKNYVYEMPNE